MQNHDPELLTRDEVLNWPPDVLITNYSMLEYMLMRPLGEASGPSSTPLGSGSSTTLTRSSF